MAYFQAPNTVRHFWWDSLTSVHIKFKMYEYEKGEYGIHCAVQESEPVMDLGSARAAVISWYPWHGQQLQAMTKHEHI